MPEPEATNPAPARNQHPLTPGGRARLARGDLEPFDLEMYANMGTGALEEALDQRNVDRPARTGWPAIVIGVAVGMLFAFVNVYVGLRTGLLFAGAWILAYAIGVGARTRAPGLALGAGAAATSSLVAAGALYAAPALAKLAGRNATPLVPPITNFVSSLFLILAAGALLGHAASVAARRAWIVRSPLPFRGTSAQVRLVERGHDASPGAGHRARQAIAGFLAGLGVASVFAILRDLPVLGGKSALDAAADRAGIGGALVDGVAGTPPSAGHFTSIGLELSPLLGALGWFMRGHAATALALGSAAAWFVAVPLAVALNVPVVHAESGGRTGLETLWRAGVESAPLAFAGPVRVLAVGALLGASLAAFLRILPATARSTRDLATGIDARSIGPALASTVVAAFGLSVAGLGPEISIFGAAIFAGSFTLVGPYAIRAVGEGHPQAVPILAATAFGLLAALAALMTTNTAAWLAMAALATAGFATAVATGAGSLLAMRTGLYAGLDIRPQTRAHLAGVAGAALAAAGAGALFASAPLAAPQSHLVLVLAESVAGSLDATLLILGLGFGLVADLVSRRGVLLALGLFLPIAVAAPILLGALAREIWERNRATLPEERRATRRLGTLLVAAGLVVGESAAAGAIALLFT